MGSAATTTAMTATTTGTTAAAAARGAFLLFEGIDRCGKSTQAARLAAVLAAHGVPHEVVRFPDRSTPVGGLIARYLSGGSGAPLALDDRAIHLLFAANRWEHAADLRAKLVRGTTLVVDRYAFSGVAYSAAKGLDLRFCRAPDAGLPAPDCVFFLDLAAANAARRGRFGEERYERTGFLERVRAVFARELVQPDWHVLDAALPSDALHAEVARIVLATIERVRALRPPLGVIQWPAEPERAPPRDDDDDDDDDATVSHEDASAARDPVVCTRGDVSLRASDAALAAAPRAWLNDALVAFHLEGLRPTLRRGVRVLAPAVVHLARLLPRAAAADALAPLELASADLVVAPCNDHTKGDTPGGTHWSLLVYRARTHTITHYDSAAPANGPAARTVAAALAPLLDPADPPALIEAGGAESGVPQQDNGFDCGAFLLLFAEAVLAENARGGAVPHELFAGVGPESARAMRARLRTEVEDQIARERAAVATSGGGGTVRDDPDPRV